MTSRQNETSSIKFDTQNRFNSDNFDANRMHDNSKYRYEFINTLLSKNKVKPIIDFDDPSTEAFIEPKKINDNDSDSSSSNTNKFKGSIGSTGTSRIEKENDIRFLLDKQEYDFMDVITSIGGKLSYIKSGSTGHTFKGTIQRNGKLPINYGVKVVAFSNRDDYGDINDAKRPENAELLIIRLLSYFVVNNHTPHIVLPICTFYSDIEPFTQLIEFKTIKDDNQRYQKFIRRYNKGKYHDKVSILMSEWANRGDLLDYIKKKYLDDDFNTMTWKVIFFQILSVLAVIHTKYPGFRHNDLKANNILIHKIEKTDKIQSYKIARNQYYFPNVGYRIKLWDFDFASIPGIVDNNKVNAEWTNFINVKPVQNRYYDMHYFFNTLINKNFFPEIMTHPKISNEIKSFINRIVPPKYQTGKYLIEKGKGRIAIDIEYLTPNQVLMKDPFFAEFRCKPEITKSIPLKPVNDKKKRIMTK